MSKSATKELNVVNHGNEKFPLLDAYALRKEGWTLQQIADKYGVYKSAVSQRFNRHFPEHKMKHWLTIRKDILRAWEADNIEKLVNMGLEKATMHQINGNLLTIKQLLDEGSANTGDININIINILEKQLGSDDTPKVSQVKDPVIEAEYHQVNQIDNTNV